MLPVVLQVAARSPLPRRSWIALVATIAVAAAALPAALSYSRELGSAYEARGSERNVVVLAKGAGSDAASVLPRRTRRVIAAYPRVAVKRGVPLVSPELAIESRVSVLGRRDVAVMAVRGIEPAFFEVEQIDVVNGSPSLHGRAVLVGRPAQRRLGVRVGSVISMFGERWVVGGLFDDRAGVLDVGILADLDDVMKAAGREAYSSLTVRADRADDVSTLVHRLERDGRIAVTAVPERDRDVGARRRAIAAAWLGVLGALLGLAGAALGLRSAMVAVVPCRARDIGTLRALGFGATAVLVTLVAEPVAVGAAGGLLAIALRALVGGPHIGVLPAHLRLDLTPGIVGSSLAVSVVVALAGGAPAVRRVVKQCATAAPASPTR